ncbi:MAG: hypothetical protein M1825_003892 [Sarcosagium campestre]|nr:MAG: hypothetical protein M1825_003892 [Sarcosagium campestre]
MNNLTETDRNIIAEHPLDKCLRHLRDPLLEAEQDCKAGSLSYDGSINGVVSGPQKAISRLLSTLQSHEVALNLRSKIGGSNVGGDLSKLFGLVQSGRYNYEDYRTLSRLVVKQASDFEIWSAVLDLVTAVSQTTPPASRPLSFDGTPITVSSSSFQDSEQTRKIIESAMFHEIKGCTYRNVGGFFEKYFQGRRWSGKCKAIYDTARQQQFRDGCWTDLFDRPDENAVWDWLSRFQDRHLSDSHGILQTTESTAELTGGEALRQLDVFVKKRGNTGVKEHDWKDVCVIGEVKRSTWPLKKILLQLARYMRDAFTAQPTRRFIHGFFLHGSTMELWVFDRSGPYSSGEFDIHEEPERFIEAIVGYTMMDDEELGLDIFTEQENTGRSIAIPREAATKDDRMQLDEAPFVRQRAVVCRGTTCFRSSDGANVVKFSWTSDKRRPEADHLRLALERGVEGIARIIGYRRIGSIAELRSGLSFQSRHVFRDGNASTSTSSQIRPPPGRPSGPTSSKRSRPGDEPGSRKKSRSDGQRSGLSQQYEPEKAPGEPASSLYEVDKGRYSNRVFGCLAIAPAGRALSEFSQTPVPSKLVPSAIGQLLSALRDAIRAHRSLYLKGNILHRDISENNIIVTRPDESGGFVGMLIDLDLAKVLGSGRSGARHQTGTMEFMAIEVLLGVDHTYRHDLESFFYVLIWLCARRGWHLCGRPGGRPKESVLAGWYSGSLKSIARSKEGYMHFEVFEDILDEFPTAFGAVKHLCRELRGILFPVLDNGALFKGTRPGPPEELYDAIIQAFDGAIKDICSGYASG